MLSMTPYHGSCHLLLPFAPLVDGKEGAFDKHDDKDDDKCDNSNVIMLMMSMIKMRVVQLWSYLMVPSWRSANPNEDSSALHQLWSEIYHYF